jgi:uncharacterized protein YegP (UPF0339 family)
MIEVFTDKEDHWRYHIKGKNGEIMATSEDYSSKDHAIRGAEDLALLFTNAAKVRFIDDVVTIKAKD